MKRAELSKYIAEAIGTFALVFCGTGAIVIDNVRPGSIGNGGIAVTFGLIVMAMIFSFRHVSGAHINPAVSIAFWVNKQLDSRRLAGYLIAQFAGGIFASIVLRLLFVDHLTLGITQPQGAIYQTFFLEVILTFMLMLVIFKVSSAHSSVAKFTAVAVGAVVLLEAYFAGPITGASMNPSRSLAPALVSGNMEFLWIYLIATPVDALLSIPVHRITQIQDSSHG